LPLSYFGQIRIVDHLRKALAAVASIVGLALMGTALTSVASAETAVFCEIDDFDPPTGVRTQPNTGALVGLLHNGDQVRIIDRARAATNGRWPAGSLWDFVEVREGTEWRPFGWVYDRTVRCQ
jgi:hypothetical protein